ncbi:cancer/testis antigen 55-like [Microtus oregoni]|uniref:cancer/testis antigen 55-like n=1 Tax=Microtus oregoni TaxID=111838 RepID=UPI001BB11676|nr:cancer/testis antigen 55-like [Microtus oregoni]
MQRILRGILNFFWRRAESDGKLQIQDNFKLKSVRGIVTHLCPDYGWINETIFFHISVVIDNMPVSIGRRVIALVEEDETTHILKAVKVKIMTNCDCDTKPSELDRELCIMCVTSVSRDNIYISKETSIPAQLFSGEFMPYKGDFLLIDYSLKPGNSNMNIHTVSPLNSQRISEVCVTSINGRTGVVDDFIFFTLDSLHTLPVYIPALNDIVNVVVVDSIQSHYTCRVVAMFPVKMLY